MTELKRRNVFRVGVAYAIVGWLLLEVASVIFPGLHLPDWTLTFLIVLVVAGFPLALILAWAFELTPEGIKRDKDIDPAESITHVTGRKLDFAIIGLLAVALIFVVVDNYVLEAEPEPVEVAAEETPEAEPIEREKSIAVLPFDNISPDPDDAYFADGIHDEILAQISKIRDIKVISRTSVMRYRGEDKPSSPEIGAALGVANLLEGSVRLAGNRVRITIQFIEAERDAHLWTEIYDRELTAANIFSIQSEIATMVADALRATLTPEEQELLDTIPTENMAALEAYFHGKQQMANLTTVALAEAVDYFEQAIELDPNFVLAHVELASTHLYQITFSGLPHDQMIARAESLIDRALELDGQSGEAHTALGAIHEERGEYERAEAAYQRALELNPNYADAYASYGGLLQSGLGRPEEALSLHRKAIDLSPLSVVYINYLGWCLEALGRFDEALTQRKKALDIDPDHTLTHWNVATYHWWISGDYGEAARSFRKSISPNPDDPWNPADLGMLFMDLGDLDQAEHWIHRSIELGPQSPIANVGMQLLYLYRGDEAAALDYGRKADEIGNNWYWSARNRYKLIADQELKAGRTSEARAVYEENHPELLGEEAPNVDFVNYQVAIEVALVLSRAGEQKRADQLLELAFERISTLPRLGRWGYGVADVKIYALQGDKQKALSALQRAIDEGWRHFWWYYLKQDPTLESLHDEPEFQAMVAEIEADMATQLARVREMERNGELEPIPELAAD
ncbi:MAG: tetratricopeptide repeat protein [Deltaproteobacteria bacterium]|nr:tetratricopeptide repeat protein [Deltaproteobacteria bacterium]